MGVGSCSGRSPFDALRKEQEDQRGLRASPVLRRVSLNPGLSADVRWSGSYTILGSIVQRPNCTGNNAKQLFFRKNILATLATAVHPVEDGAG